MNRTPHQPDDSWENDAVWKLLDQAPPVTASPRFADDTVRAARLMGQAEPWWKRLLAPMPLAGLAGAAAALVFSMASILGPASNPGNSTAAVDHLDDFSDNELVTLIGF